jgi:hypothetical protein
MSADGTSEIKNITISLATASFNCTMIFEFKFLTALQQIVNLMGKTEVV